MKYKRNKNVLCYLLLVFTTLVSYPIAYGKSPAPSSVVQKAKQAVVSISRQTAVSAYEVPENFDNKHGVIIDKKRGFILTTAFTVGRSVVATYPIVFFDGTKTTAKVYYSDNWLNFAILKVDTAVIPKTAIEAKLSHKNPIEGQPIFIIVTEDNKSTVHRGKISDTNIDVNQQMTQHDIGASMDNKIMATGSLMFNEMGEGIALDCLASDTLHVGLHLSYIRYALTSLQEQKYPIRQHIGALIRLYQLDDVVRYDHLPEEQCKAYIKQFPNSKNKILRVNTILNGSPSEHKLFPGDIIWAVNGKLVGPNLVDFDMIMNHENKQSLILTIFRNGMFRDVIVPLYNLENHKITKLVEFGGATFFETDDISSKQLGTSPKTLTFCFAKSNTIFAKNIMHYSYNDIRFFILKLLTINGNHVTTLDEMIKQIPNLVKQKYFTIGYISHMSARNDEFGHDLRKSNVEYDESLALPKIWKWNTLKLEWESDTIIS